MMQFVSSGIIPLDSEQNGKLESSVLCSILIRNFHEEKRIETMSTSPELEQAKEETETLRRPGGGGSVNRPGGGGGGAASTMCSMGVANIILLVMIPLFTFQ